MMDAQLSISGFLAPLPNSALVAEPLPNPPHKGEGVLSGLTNPRFSTGTSDAIGTIPQNKSASIKSDLIGGARGFSAKVRTPSPLWGGLGRGFCNEQAINIEKSVIRNQRP